MTMEIKIYYQSSHWRFKDTLVDREIKLSLVRYGTVLNNDFLNILVQSVYHMEISSRIRAATETWDLLPWVQLWLNMYVESKDINTMFQLPMSQRSFMFTLNMVSAKFFLKLFSMKKTNYIPSQMNKLLS